MVCVGFVIHNVKKIAISEILNEPNGISQDIVRPPCVRFQKSEHALFSFLTTYLVDIEFLHYYKVISAYR